MYLVSFIKAGLLRPVHVVVADNIVLNAIFSPADVSTVTTATTLGNPMFALLGQAIPERLWADSFTANSNWLLAGLTAKGAVQLHNILVPR